MVLPSESVPWNENVQEMYLMVIGPVSVAERPMVDPGIGVVGMGSKAGGAVVVVTSAAGGCAPEDWMLTAKLRATAAVKVRETTRHDARRTVTVLSVESAAIYNVYWERP
jgi:hypothetical protein